MKSKKERVWELEQMLALAIYYAKTTGKPSKREMSRLIREVELIKSKLSDG